MDRWSHCDYYFFPDFKLHDHLGENYPEANWGNINNSWLTKVVLHLFKIMPATDLRLNWHFIKVQEHIFSISVSVDSLELQAGIMHLEQMSRKHLEKHL